MRDEPEWSDCVDRAWSLKLSSKLNFLELGALECGRIWNQRSIESLVEVQTREEIEVV